MTMIASRARPAPMAVRSRASLRPARAQGPSAWTRSLACGTMPASSVSICKLTGPSPRKRGEGDARSPALLHPGQLVLPLELVGEDEVADAGGEEVDVLGREQRRHRGLLHEAGVDLGPGGVGAVGIGDRLLQG